MRDRSQNGYELSQMTKTLSCPDLENKSEYGDADDDD